MLALSLCAKRFLYAQALEKNDKALLVNVDKMAYANLYVTDGDLHVQAVDTLPTPNPRGVFDTQRTNMIGNARSVPCVECKDRMLRDSADRMLPPHGAHDTYS